MRQICDALTAAQKMAPCPGTATVVCGDFNSAGHTAVHEVLVTESVTALAGYCSVSRYRYRLSAA